MHGGSWRRGAAVAVVLLTALSGCALPAAEPGASPHARPSRTPHRADAAEPSRRPTTTPRPTTTSARPRPQPKGPVSRGWRVYDVVDGDTVKVTDGRRALTIRLIGIDTPETVDPFRPVECFGPQASAFAQRVLAGRRVLLERDPSQGRLDRYGRTLAYLWVLSGEGRWMYERRAVRHGYGVEYTYDTAYLWQRELQRDERHARQARAGLWSPRTCDGDPNRPA